MLKRQIDYKALEMELGEALKADELYKLQNDAKIRAVTQGVPTYDHFREMVNGAHLRPLEKSDITTRPEVPWNHSVNLSHEKNEESKDPQTCVKPSSSTSHKGSTLTSFLSTWNSFDDINEKFDYLWSARCRLQKIFSSEVPSTVIIQVVDVSREFLCVTQDTAKVIEILWALSKCSRFNLNLSFMSALEKSNCALLFKELKSACTEEKDIYELEKLYSVNDY